MRVKVRAGRCKPRQRPSLNPSSSATPLPSPNKDEAGKDVTCPDTYSDSDIGVQCGDAAPGMNAKVILQSRNRDSEGMHGEFMDVNWLEKRSCLKCCRTGAMLVCAETGCPIAIHEECLNCKPTVDKSGNFCCPYCSYKRAVAEYQDKRRKVMLNKKSLTSFLKPEAAAQEKEQEGDGIAAVKGTASSMGSKRPGANKSNVRNAVMEHQSKSSNQSQVKRKLRIEEAIEEEDSRVVENDLSNLVPHKRQEEASDAGHEEDAMAAVKETASSMGSKRRGANKNNARNAVIHCHSKRFNQSQVKRKLRIDEAIEEDCRVVENDLSNLVPDKQQEEASDAGHEKDGMAAVKEIASSIGRKKRGANGNIARNVVLQHQAKRLDQPQVKKKLRTNEAVQEVGSREVDSDLSDLVPDENQAEASDAGHEDYGEAINYMDEISEDEEEMEHVASPKKSSPKKVSPTGKGLRRVKTVAKKKSKLYMSCKKKRRRLIWTAEEEKMLKEGVKKFEKKNKNLPWRKILELGSEVFDVTRTPSDLKDKWKNLVARNLWQN